MAKINMFIGRSFVDQKKRYSFPLFIPDWADLIEKRPSNIIPLIADASYINFLGDDFLRLLLCRYIFCDALLRIHRSFKVRL